MVRSTVNFGLIAVICAVLMIPFGGGCGVTKEEAQGHRDVLAGEIEVGQDLVASLEEERDAALARADAAEQAEREAQAEAERAVAAMLEERIEDVNAYLAPQEEVLAAWDERIANWDETQANDLGLITDAGAAILPFLPAPAQGPAVLGVAVAGVIGRLLNRSKALNSLAESTVKLANENPEVSSAIKGAAATLRSIQTAGARKAVDAAQGKGVKIPV